MKDLPDSDIPTMGKSEMQHKILESLFGVTEYPKYEPNRMNWKKVVKKLESFGQGLEFNSPHIIDTGEKTISGKFPFSSIILNSKSYLSICVGACFSEREISFLEYLFWHFTSRF